MKDADRTQLSQFAHRAHRCVPFMVVAVCFFFPFFSLSSCDSGQQTTVTGVDIVTGSTLIRQQQTQPLFGQHTTLGAVGADATAHKASGAARPWAIGLLVLTVVGTAAALLVDHRRRAFLGAIAAISAITLLQLLESASAIPASDEFQVEGGAIVAFLALVATTLWYAIAAVVASVRRPSHDDPGRQCPSENTGTAD